jgi:hypothetical protein
LSLIHKSETNKNPYIMAQSSQVVPFDAAIAKKTTYLKGNQTAANAENIIDGTEVKATIVRHVEKEIESTSTRDGGTALYIEVMNPKTGLLSARVSDPANDLPNLPIGAEVMLLKKSNMMPGNDGKERLVHFCRLIRAVNVAAPTAKAEGAKAK